VDEGAAGVDLAGDPGAEAGDLPKGVEPAARAVEPADHRIACSCGLVASRSEVTTNWKKKTVTREITTAWLTARPTPAAPPEADIPLKQQTTAMIAPNIVHIKTEDQMSVTVAFENRFAKKPPRDWW